MSEQGDQVHFIQDDTENMLLQKPIILQVAHWLILCQIQLGPWVASL